MLKPVTHPDLSTAPDYCFVEIRRNETEADWLRAVQAELTKLFGERAPDSLDYAMGPRVHWNGRAFCSMRCWAGSVHCQLMMAAKHAGCRVDC
jgi:hypothetical protein